MKGIVLGASKFSHLNQLEVDRLLDCAIRLGVKSIDTAPSYHSSEKKIGRFMKKNPGSFEISTKILRSNENNSISSIRTSIEKSLTELNVDKISTLYIHGFELRSSHSDFINLLISYRSASMVKRLGWCGVLPTDYFFPEKLYDALMIRLNPWDDKISSRFDLHSIFEINAMNIFANWFWKYRAWNPTRAFLNAYMFRKFNPVPSFYLNHPNRESLSEYQDFDALVRFAYNYSFVKNIVIGTTNPLHLELLVNQMKALDRESQG